jgi:hypothetical protein
MTVVEVSRDRTDQLLSPKCRISGRKLRDLEVPLEVFMGSSLSKCRTVFRLSLLVAYFYEILFQKKTG